jgi:hypothetical protein
LRFGDSRWMGRGRFFLGLWNFDRSAAAIALARFSRRRDGRAKLFVASWTSELDHRYLGSSSVSVCRQSS